MYKEHRKYLGLYSCPECSLRSNAAVEYSIRKNGQVGYVYLQFRHKNTYHWRKNFGTAAANCIREGDFSALTIGLEKLNPLTLSRPLHTPLVRAPAVLKVVELTNKGLTLKQIAHELGLTRGTVRSYRHRARYGNSYRLPTSLRYMRNGKFVVDCKYSRLPGGYASGNPVTRMFKSEGIWQKRLVFDDKKEAINFLAGIIKKYKSNFSESTRRRQLTHWLNSFLLPEDVQQLKELYSSHD